MDAVLTNKTAAEINSANARKKGTDGTGGQLPSVTEPINNERVLAKTMVKGPDGKLHEVTEHSQMGLPKESVLCANHVSEMNMWLNENHVGGRQVNAKGREHPVYLQKFDCAFCDDKFNHLLQSLCTEENHLGYDTHVRQNHGEDLSKQWIDRAKILSRDGVVESKDEEFAALKAENESQGEKLEILQAQVEALLAVNEDKLKGK